MPRTIVAFIALSIGVASAQPIDDRAKDGEASRLYDEGKRHFDIGEYAQAITSWKRSYLLSSAPLLLFNIAQAYRLSNNCAEANRFYFSYRRVDKQPKNQAELDKAMAKCAGVEPATGDATTPEPVTPPTTPATAEPATGSPPSEPPVTSSTPAVSPSPPKLPATSQPSGRGGGWRTAGVITTSVGAAVLVASGLYALKAKQDSDTLSHEPVGTPYAGDAASTDASGKTAATRGKGLLAIGAVLAVGGGVMWFVGHRQGESHVDVAIIPGHAEVMFSCAF